MTARCPYGLMAVLAVCACVAGCDRAQARASESASPAAESASSAAESAAPAPTSSETESASPAAESAADFQARRKRHAEKRRKRHVKAMRKAVKVNTHEGKGLAHAQKLLRELEDSARAALPADATPEQVRAELEGNPQKYPGYHQLVLAAAERRAEMRNNHVRAQKSIRAHRQSEVAEGRARGAATAAK